MAAILPQRHSANYAHAEAVIHSTGSTCCTFERGGLIYVIMRAPAHGSIAARVTILAIVLVLLPLVLVHLSPTDTVEPFVFRAQLSEMVGQSENGQLSYYKSNVLEGSAPAAIIVVALDRSYSRGYEPLSTAPGRTVWMQGGLMTPDVFYGEQYLFFGLSQVYVRQVKTGLLWPDQWSGLRVLYLSPAETLAAPMQLPFLVRSDSFAYGLLAVLVARCLLIASTAYVVVRKRLRAGRLVAAIMAYAVMAMLLTIPILGDMY